MFIVAMSVPMPVIMVAMMVLSNKTTQLIYQLDWYIFFLCECLSHLMINNIYQKIANNVKFFTHPYYV